MSKLLKDPYELYGESKDKTQDPFYQKKAPSYHEVRKALRFRRALWMVPSGLAVGGAAWAVIAAGIQAVLVSGIILALAASLGLVLWGANYLIDRGIDESQVLAYAKEYGISEESDDV